MSETLATDFASLPIGQRISIGRAGGLSERDAEICRRFKTGEIGSNIAASFGITGERVRQVLKANGLTGKDGGAHLCSEVRAARIAAERVERQADIRARQVAFVTRVAELRAEGKTWVEANEALGRKHVSAGGLQNYTYRLIARCNLPHLLDAIHSYDGRCRNAGRPKKAAA